MTQATTSLWMVKLLTKYLKNDQWYTMPVYPTLHNKYQKTTTVYNMGNSLLRDRVRLNESSPTIQATNKNIMPSIKEFKNIINMP